MTYQKKDWSPMGKSRVRFQLIVKDQDFKRLESINFNVRNFGDTINDIMNRYGIGDALAPSNEESFNDEMDFLKKANLL